MVGRKRNKHLEELGFMLLKENTKYFAKCDTCNKLLTNTSVARLKSHRLVSTNV